MAVITDKKMRRSEWNVKYSLEKNTAKNVKQLTKTRSAEVEKIVEKMPMWQIQVSCGKTKRNMDYRIAEILNIE